MLPEIAPRRIPTTSRAAPALARIGFTLAVERLMEREFGIKDHGQEARPGKAAWKHMKGRQRLADLLVRPAGELLPDVLDGLPLPWHPSKVSVMPSPSFESLVEPATCTCDYLDD